MGISQALGNLDPGQLAKAPQEAFGLLKTGLYVAFDTTSVALAMSLILMFIQFPLDRVEVELLSTVSQRTADMLQGRFQQTGGSHDPHVASTERMCYAVMRSVENLVQRQADLWRATMDDAHHQWQEGWNNVARHVQTALTDSLDSTLSQHAACLSRVEEAATESAERRWQAWQAALEQNADVLREQQAGIHQQSELLARVVEATGDVTQLERALNENLRGLAGAKHFEDTVMSLAAAIHLLTARLDPSVESRKVELRKSGSQAERAA
jgi:hypothetical protein